MNQREIIEQAISDLQVTSDWIDDIIRRVKSINSDAVSNVICSCANY